MRKLGSIAALLMLAGWVPSPDPDLTTLVMTSDAAVVAKRLGDETHDGRTVGKYQIVRALHGRATGTVLIEDGAYRHPDEEPQRLLFLKRLSADEQTKWKLPEWSVQFDGARIVVKGVVHDFHAEDARFNLPSGTYLDRGSRSVMVTHAQTRDDPAFDGTKTGHVREGELVDAGVRAVARAAELRAALKLPAGAARNTRLLALLPVPRPAGAPPFMPHVPATDLVDLQILRAVVESRDGAAVLEAMSRVRNDDESWRPVLRELALDKSQPEPLRARAIAAFSTGSWGVFVDLLEEPSIAIRKAVAETAVAQSCLSSWEKEAIDRAVRVEKDPTVRPLLVRADRKRQCPG